MFIKPCLRYLRNRLYRKLDLPLNSACLHCFNGWRIYCFQINIEGGSLAQSKRQVVTLQTFQTNRPKHFDMFARGQIDIILWSYVCPSICFKPTHFQGEVSPCFGTDLYFTEIYKRTILISQCSGFFLNSILAGLVLALYDRGG